MDSFSYSDCSPAFVKKRRSGNQADAPEGSRNRAQCEVVSILYGENAFVYDGVAVEEPEKLPSSSVSNYEWASRDVSEFPSIFDSRAVLLNWANDNCILRNLSYGSCVKLVACGENERVFYGKENSKDDFFYVYSYLFYDMYLRFPLNVFQMDVLKTLNVAPTQLHPNSWGYIQAFAVMCQALAINPTVALFFYFFRTRPIEKRGWVSLITEPGDAILELYAQSFRGFKNQFFRVSITESGRSFFFNEDSSSKFPLYWTQNPRKLTSWPKEDMTDIELEALSVIAALPRPFSSRKIINCLEHDDMNSRVLAVMGKKASLDWFAAAHAKKNKGGSSILTTVKNPIHVDDERPPPEQPLSRKQKIITGGDSKASDKNKGGTSALRTIKNPIHDDDESPPSPERPLSRKRKAATGGDPKASNKGKSIGGVVDPHADRDIPNGMWDAAFNLGHKIEFNFDLAEQKVMEKTSEQKMADYCLEFACRAAAAAWNLAYASNRGNLVTELERLKTEHAKCEQQRKESEKMIVKGREITENLQKASVEMKKVNERLVADLEFSRKENEQLKKSLTILTAEREALRQTITENQELQDEMTDAIILEHTRGFKKALRQVSYILNVCTEGVNFDIRKDVYQGEWVPIDVIPAGSFPDDEPAGTPTEAMATEEAARIETPEGNSGVPAVEDAPVVDLNF
ncbi:uncharacterized protein HKW66_Vig0152510 [Vigna angularis]|uniref:Transposase (putative) gypsy type domain-containing protein n=2 Tax=Phaseolus angularis TaxID=3914 RepID=A0A8T0JTP1_PHAAN|nr:uncharacterized protein LOC108346020 isoform X1 [Vigna angularis]KAG2383986.1 uncharacterized protein HKW66_Vig0152510 [Vigna angularis]